MPLYKYYQHHNPLITNPEGFIFMGWHGVIRNGIIIIIVMYIIIFIYHLEMILLVNYAAGKHKKCSCNPDVSYPWIHKDRNSHEQRQSSVKIWMVLLE